MKRRKTLPMFLFVLSVSLAALPMSSTLVTLAQGEQTAPPLFAPAAPPDGMAPAATTIRARFVAVDFGQIVTSETESLTLNLFDDATYVAVRTGSSTPGPDRIVWQGMIKDVPDSQVTLALYGQAMAGTVSLPGALYQISDTGRGVHVVEQVQTSDPLPEAQPIPVPPEGLRQPDAAPMADTGAVVDVMVLYTPASRVRYGQAGIQARIDLAVAEANQAYANSQIATQLRLVYRAEVAYTEATSMEIDLDRLRGKTDGYLDYVHALRNAYRADLVTLIEENYAYCGIAYQMSALSPTFESSAFSVVASSCAAGYYSFAHELGHNMGSQHDRVNALTAPVSPYSYGAWASNQSFRTIMAYDCPNGCQRVQYFSNPNVLYQGLPTGISYQVDPANAADNARSLNDTLVTVANWRDSTAPPPVDAIYVSSMGNGTAGEVAFNDEDIMAYNTETHGWSMIFDGSDVGMGGDVDGFSLLADGSLLLSFDASFTLSPLGTVDDSDIIRFIPTSLGATTAGQAEWYFDASDVGLSTNDEDIDSIGFASDGKLVVGVLGLYGVTDASGAALSGDDVDLLAFTPTQLGATTSGTWSLYFDGSDVALTPGGNEDVHGAWIDPATNKIYLNTLGAFSVTGVTGAGDDVFICTPGPLGATTSCTYGPGLYWDGSANGFSKQVVDGLAIVKVAPVNTPTPTPTPPPGGMPTPTPTPTSTPTPMPVPAELLYVSSAGNGSTGGGGASYNDEDIVSYNSTTHTWSMVFDGSDVGVGGARVDAFSFLADGSLLLSFDVAFTLGSFGAVDDSDIVQFVPTSLGETTAGQFLWYFDASDVGLDTDDEDIDAIAFTPDGKLVLSVVGAFSVPAVHGDDVDLLAFNANSLGATTSGTWDLYFDGSDVELTPLGNEDVTSVWIDPTTNKIYLGTLGAFAVTGVTGNGDDVFICTPGTLGATTTCTYGPGIYWDGAANGFDHGLDALEIVRS